MSAGGGALAVHPGALGDVLLAVPALRAFRGAGPLTLAAQPRIGELLAALGVVDGAVPLERLGLEALFVDDPALSPALPPVERVVAWLGAREPVFVRRLQAAVPGAVVAASTAADRPVWEHLLATVGAPPGPWREPIRVPPEIAERGRAALAGCGWDRARPLLLVHPGASGAGKRWPAEAYAEVVRRARGRAAVVVHEGPLDAEAAAAVAEAPGLAAPRLRHPALPTLAGALAHATAFLGNDSGVAQLAAAVGTPAVVVFPPATVGWAPWSPSARVVVAADTAADTVARVAEALGALVG